MDIQVVEWGGMCWIALAQDRGRSWPLVNMVTNLRVSQNEDNFLTSYGPVSFLGRTPLHGVS